MIELFNKRETESYLSSAKGLKSPPTVMLGLNLASSTVRPAPASWRTVLRPARLGWESRR